MKILTQLPEKKNPSLYDWIASGDDVRVTCEFSLAELRVLRLLTSRITGGPQGTVRKWTNSILCTLAEHPSMFRPNSINNYEVTFDPIVAKNIENV